MCLWNVVNIKNGFIYQAWLTSVALSQDSGKIGDDNKKAYFMIENITIMVVNIVMV